MEITDFGTVEMKKQKDISIYKYNEECSENGITLKVKKSLDNMYKTTQSITNSEEKSLKNIQHPYKKVLLNNGFYYEGEVNQEGEFEGNGFLYDDKGQVIYSGSWSHSEYHGFGTLQNRDVRP